MRVRWSPAARDDFRQRIRYIALDSPSTARLVAYRVRKATSDLTLHPHLGHAGRVTDTRELVIPDTSFTAAYRVRQQVVEIVGLVHQAQAWPENFDCRRRISLNLHGPASLLMTIQTGQRGRVRRHERLGPTTRMQLSVRRRQAFSVAVRAGGRLPADGASGAAGS
jgi:toxin ParE1/3/4